MRVAEPLVTSTNHGSATNVIAVPVLETTSAATSASSVRESFIAAEYSTSVRFCKVTGMPKVSDAHRAERREQILTGARRAFSTWGYERATVARLEEEIGLSRGAIFSYFPSKWELFFALATADQQRVGEMWLELGFEGVVRHFGDEDPDWLGAYLEVMRLLRTDPAVRTQWQSRNPELHEQIVADLERQRADGTQRSDVPLESVGMFLGVVLDGLAVHRGAGVPIDVEGTLEFVRAALAPK
jgi:TetR/AcrR family transcriptional regulator, transcriptional repressor of aconitase